MKQIKLHQQSNGSGWTAEYKHMIGRSLYHYGHGATPEKALKALRETVRKARAKYGVRKTLKLRYKIG